ncbi:MAG: integrin alpha [Acidimicrobiales bacterium]
MGAPGDDDGGSGQAVYVLFLNADGTVKAEQKISDTSGGLLASLDDGDNFGEAVEAIGDIDGDGITDLAVGAVYDDDGGTDRAVYVLFLNAYGTVKASRRSATPPAG